MILRNSINLLSDFFFLVNTKIRKYYLNSNIYNKKISKTDYKILDYRPSLNILDCLIKYEKKKYKIDDFLLNSIWTNKNLSKTDYKKLHSFFWLFSIDLKSSKDTIQSIIEKWISQNKNYDNKNWEIDTLSKRIISWISNTKLTYENSSDNFREQFNFIIKKQTNHLINEINRSELVDDKMIGCTAIVMTGLCYKDQKYLSYGLNLLKKISIISFDNTNFPKSRSLRQLVFYLKYFVLIRELLKESQNEIPEYLDEKIFYLGLAYNFIYGNNKLSYLFNGNHETTQTDFDNYLKLRGYKFRTSSNEIGGYIILKNKYASLIMDAGVAPGKKFSSSFQSGPLSFEFVYKDKKLISNSGYFQNPKHQLNSISRSTAAHSTLVIDNTSVSKFKKNKYGNYYIENNYKIFDKKIVFDKKQWNLSSSHDGYQKQYGLIHQRKIEFYPNKNILIGKDKLIKKKNHKSVNFDIRFHLAPYSKASKTQNGKVILIELDNSGWKFRCDEYLIDIETGLYFGKKNSYTENQNIFISGQTRNEDQVVCWSIEKI
tara:strand:+ start:255 stop:1883 length:1629 start_codon:yes stop_codon:yes gene_type:complete